MGRSSAGGDKPAYTYTREEYVVPYGQPTGKDYQVTERSGTRETYVPPSDEDIAKAFYQQESTRPAMDPSGEPYTYYTNEYVVPYGQPTGVDRQVTVQSGTRETYVPPSSDLNLQKQDYYYNRLKVTDPRAAEKWRMDKLDSNSRGDRARTSKEEHNKTYMTDANKAAENAFGNLRFSRKK